MVDDRGIDAEGRISGAGEHVAHLLPHDAFAKIDLIGIEQDCPGIADELHDVPEQDGDECCEPQTEEH